ncbi:cation-translocating P-type ATPase [Nocardia stercoris]|uniref:HAD family hydrolase n=1 Tax=Nocardia stercoris TaxID=2483361 RepID=A0A3M2L0Z9_9NOCA|nr:cation-translocating P-type ATPase [Nocardia stercoris]RMI30410.1 HAD family hydrolase [Nocardia stercoris]
MATGALRTGVDLGTATVVLPVRAAGRGVDVASRVVEVTVPGIGRRMRDDLRTLADFRPQRHQRRVDIEQNRVGVEVRGLSGADSARVAAALEARLSRIGSVRWWRINAVTGRLVAGLGDVDTGLAKLIATIAAAEAGADVADRTWDRAVEHPADREPLLAAGIQLATDATAVGFAMIGWFLPGGGPLRWLRSAGLLIDSQPLARTRMEAVLGRVRTDLVVTLATAVGGAAGESVSMLVLDTAQRGFTMLEAAGSYLRWREWEATDARRAQSEARVPLRAHERPIPLPPGPVERVAAETATGSLLGATGFALAGRFGRAVSAVELGAPKAARASREVYAATVSTLLARAGVLTLHPAAWRRLDRLSAVVVAGEALLTSRRIVLEAESTDPGTSTAYVWSEAQRLAGASDGESGSASGEESGSASDGESGGASDGESGGASDGESGSASGEESGSASDGESGGASDGESGRASDGESGRASDDESGRASDDESCDASGGESGRASGDESGSASGPRWICTRCGSECRTTEHGPAWHELRSGAKILGRALVGRELDPRAHSILAAARAAGVLVVLTGAEDVGELRSLADRFVPAAEPSSTLIGDLQRDGHVVALLGVHSQQALDWADIGIGLARFDGDELTVPWSADLLCRDLAQAQRILNAIGPARQVSERGRTLALSGCALAGLLLATTRGRAADSAPLVAANVGALVSGAVAGVRAGAGRPAGPAARLLPWHALEPGEVLGRLPAPPPPPERSAAERRSRIPAPPGVRAISDFAGTVRRELSDPLAPILGVGALATAMLGSPGDAFLLSSVLTANAVVSALQRQRAERALQRMIEREQRTGRVLRRDDLDRDDPPAETVPAELLTVGDIIVLRAGDVVPADARLLAADSLELDESALTGESTTVDKQVDATPGVPLGDRACMVFDGSTVVNGAGRAVVVATGRDTQAGRAGTGAAPPDSGGVQAQLRSLTDRVLPLTIGAGGAVTALGGMRGRILRRAIADGVGVAVAAVPEGLPLVATLAQLAAARRLARYGILVRASRTVEALGRIDTLCFDKTGTLTEGRLRLTALADPWDQWSVDDESPDSRRLLRAAVRACPDPRDGPARHATDRAVLDAGRQFLSDDPGQWERVDELPFESNRGYAATVGRTDSTLRVYVKGAPEVVVPRCDGIRDSAGDRRPLGAEQREQVRRTVLDLAAQGLRVLVVARRDLRQRPRDIEEEVDHLTLLGFVGLADPPRAHSVELVKALQDSGIGVRMITGDHPATAAAIARQLGIGGDRVTTGADLDELDEAGQSALIGRSTVFARVDPEHKVRIVALLRRAGHVVGMTGDGSNDAAAIRSADIGIGLAARGSVAARNAADLVLTEPEPLVLLDALVEGRSMWQRVSDAVGVLVGGNAGEVGFTLYGTAVAGRAPMTTRQFLLVNMLTDMFPALALALAEDRSRVDGDGDGTDVSDRAVRRTAELAFIPPAASATDLARTVGVRGIATAVGASAAWTVARYTGTRRRAATVGLVSLVGTQLGQTLLSGRGSPLVWLTTLGSGVVLVTIVMTPGLNTYFGCRPLGPLGWATALTATAVGTAVAQRLPALLPGPDGTE